MICLRAVMRRCSALLRRARPGWAGGLGELAGEGDGAADGARDAVEGDGELGCCGGWGGLSGGLWGGLAVDGAGEAAADLDQFVQDLAVVLGVLVALARRGGARVVGRVGEGGAGGHRGG